jgi:hypothetical protein
MAIDAVALDRSACSFLYFDIGIRHGHLDHFACVNVGVLVWAHGNGTDLKTRGWVGSASRISGLLNVVYTWLFQTLFFKPFMSQLLDHHVPQLL